MNKALLIAVCSIACFVSICRAQSRCATLEDGSVSGQTYSNKALGIIYTFPETLSRDTSGALPRDRNGRVLLALWKTPHDLQAPNIVLMTDDPSAYRDQTAIGYLRRIENTAKRFDPPAKILQTGAEYTFSGLKFYRVDYQFPEPKAYYDTAITGQINGCELSFQIMAHTKEEIENFVSSVKSVKFAK